MVPQQDLFVKSPIKNYTFDIPHKKENYAKKAFVITLSYYWSIQYGH